MIEITNSLEKVGLFVKQYQNTFRSPGVRSQMDTTDAQHNVKQQLKIFQKEYKTIQENSKRIDRATSLAMQEDYAHRHECACRVLLRKIQSWFAHYKNDVMCAMDIVINNHMLKRSQRPFRCRPPVRDHNDRYYFGRTVDHNSVLAVRANYEGQFLIQGWLKYDTHKGAHVELFQEFVPYIEDNVAQFTSSLVVLDETPTNSSTYHNNLISTALVICETPSDGSDSEDEEEVSEEMEHHIQVHAHTHTAEPPPLVPPPTSNQPTVNELLGFYVHAAALKQHLATHFTHATINIDTLIKKRYSRRHRLYALKEAAYKRVVEGNCPIHPPLKDQCDELRKLLLGLWKQKAFICSPHAFLRIDSCERNNYVHVTDGVL